jgi:hypothetical protein
MNWENQITACEHMYMYPAYSESLLRKTKRISIAQNQ